MRGRYAAFFYREAAVEASKVENVGRFFGFAVEELRKSRLSICGSQGVSVRRECFVQCSCGFQAHEGAV
jgi:hypothetical protein